jgi:hypothetical protein
MKFDIVSKLAYFNTTPADKWAPEDKKLFYDITRIISDENKYVQDDISMDSWTKRSKRKIKPPTYLEKAVLESSELNKFKIIQNPDCLSCKPDETRLLCIKTKEEGSISGAYFIGLDALEEKLDEFYSKKK